MEVFVIFFDRSIIVDVDKIADVGKILSRIRTHASSLPMIQVKYFSLHKIHGINGYVEHDLETGKLQFRHVSKDVLPLVIRAVQHEEPEINDAIMMYKGMPVRSLHVPEVVVGLSREWTV